MAPSKANRLLFQKVMQPIAADLHAMSTSCIAASKRARVHAYV
jgi:hypothetical protein